MEEQRKGPGIFYAVVGVATLVVAIIGATFAYFSATAEDQEFTGTTATAGSLTLEVTPVWPETGESLPNGLIPLDEEGTAGSTGILAKALAAAKKCRDDNNDVACHVYEITVTNGGDASVLTSTKLALAFENVADVTPAGTTEATNWRWQVIDGSATAGFAVTGTPVIGDAVLAAKEVGNVTLTPTGTTGASDTYYVVVWLEDSNAAQTEYSVNFTGTVSASSVDATGAKNGVTATFRG